MAYTPNIDRGIQTILAYAGDDSHGYELQSRNYDFGVDCAGLVMMYAAAVENVPLDQYPNFHTWNEKDTLTARGWKAIVFSTEAMRRGDILLRALGDSSGHTVIYYGDGYIIGAEGDWDGRAGDSSGTEVCKRTYYDYNYNWILRYEEDVVIQIDKVADAIYRLYNTYADMHHFTSSHTEAQTLVNTGWTLEGTDLNIKGGTVQQYRLYNQFNGAHLVTDDATEAVTLACIGWTLEGYAFKTPATGKAVARLYNPNNGDHLYTISDEEITTCVNAGWKNEGNSFFVNA